MANVTGRTLHSLDSSELQVKLLMIELMSALFFLLSTITALLHFNPLTEQLSIFRVYYLAYMLIAFRLPVTWGPLGMFLTLLATY